MSSNSSSDMVMPPGIRFMPTDEELVSHYLTNKLASINVNGEQQQFYNLKMVVDCNDVYYKHPWVLAKDDKDASNRMKRDGALYFYVHMTKKDANGSRPSRKVPHMGFWKATSSAKKVVDDHGKVIGMKRNLVYHFFKDYMKTSSKDGTKTSWIMYEYHVVDPNKNPDDDKNFQEWVLCRISNSGRQPSSTTNSSTSMLEAAAVSSDHDQVPCTSAMTCCIGHPAATDQSTLSTTPHHQQLLGKQKQHPLIATDDEAAYSMVSINDETNQVVQVEEDSCMLESDNDQCFTPRTLVHLYMTTPYVEGSSYNYSHLTNTSSMLEAAAVSSDHDQVPCTSAMPCCIGDPAATDQTLSTTPHHQQLLGKQKQHPLIATYDEAAYSMVSINDETNQVVQVEEDSCMLESDNDLCETQRAILHLYMTTPYVEDSCYSFREGCSYNYSHLTNTSSVLEAAAIPSDHDQVPCTSTMPCCGGHPAATDQILSATLHHQTNTSSMPEAASLSSGHDQVPCTSTMACYGGHPAAMETLSTTAHQKQLLGKRKKHPLIATDDEAAYSMLKK